MEQVTAYLTRNKDQWAVPCTHCGIYHFHEAAGENDQGGERSERCTDEKKRLRSVSRFLGKGYILKPSGPLTKDIVRVHSQLGQIKRPPADLIWDECDASRLPWNFATLETDEVT